MSQYENLGHRYLAALGAQLDALTRENDVLLKLQNAAEVIAATPNDIEVTVTANVSRIKQLTQRIADLSNHLANVHVSDF